MPPYNLSKTRVTNPRIDANRIIAVGYGETMSIEANENADGSDNPERRQKNRRTEVKITIFLFKKEFANLRYKYE